MVIREIARLAHAHGVEQSVTVRAVPGVLVPAVLPVAAGAHVLNV